MNAPTRPRPRLVPQTGPAVWLAADLTAADWMVPLGAEEAAELEAALTAAKAAAPVPPLTRLARVLGDVVSRLDTGRGFCLLRGLHKFHRAVDRIVVGQRQRRQSQFGGTLRQLGGRAGAVEQAEIAVAMQLTVNHCLVTNDTNGHE